MWELKGFINCKPHSWQGLCQIEVLFRHIRIQTCEGFSHYSVHILCSINCDQPHSCSIYREYFIHYWLSYGLIFLIVLCTNLSTNIHIPCWGHHTCSWHIHTNFLKELVSPLRHLFLLWVGHLLSSTLGLTHYTTLNIVGDLIIQSRPIIISPH